MVNNRFLYLLFCYCFFVIQNLVAQQSLPSTINAYRIHSRIEINGVFDEPEWNLAQHISNFTQRELDESKPVTERTEVAVIYDEENLYFGIWCYDREPQKIIAKKMEWDFGSSTDDNFKIIIDTYHDKRNGYRFITNPNGAMADAVIIDNGARENDDWNGVWMVETSMTNEGWFAEIEIPFSTLKFRSASEQIWGINFERNIRRKLEQVRWQGWSRDAHFDQLSRAGMLVGLEDISDVKLLEFRPYAIGGIERRYKTNGQSIADFGGDLNYLITPTMKLNLTINTDFAQVESDREQINLTRFSISYPEKRKFFLEGKNFFDFELGEHIRPFYSRRIGISENRSEIPILGGARILGKQGNSTLGGMVLQTSRKDSIPSANYSVFRWKQDILEESTIGIIGISKAESGRFNGTYGMDFQYSTSSMFGDKNLSTGITFSQTFTSDAANNVGNAHRIFIEYPNDLIEFEAVWERSGENFNPEVGFLKRKSFQMIGTELGINPRPKFIPWIHQMEFKPLELQYYIDDKTRELQSLFMEFVPLCFSTKNGESFEFNIGRDTEKLVKDFEIQDDIVIPKETYSFTRYGIDVETFEGRTLSTSLEFRWGEFYNGSCTSLDSRINWRMSKFFSISADYENNIINLPAGNFQTNEVGGRAEFAINPRLFGSFFGQWNDEDDEILLNFRVNWIPRPGSDFFFVFNQSIDTGERSWVVSKTTVLSKFVWRFVL